MVNLLKKFREGYFNEVAGMVPSFPGKVVVLTHCLPDRPELLQAIEKIAPIERVIVIPYSIDISTLQSLREDYKVDTPTLEELLDPTYMKTKLREIIQDGPVIIHEIGGYFAPILPELKEEIKGKLIGIVESTESGHRRYASLPESPCPVISVARGSIKKAEYSLVGRSCVFSLETLLHSVGAVVSNKKILILGYGKIGKGVAITLKEKGCSVFAYDTNQIENIMAISEGMSSIPKREALSQADVILGASGNYSLTEEDFKYIKPGAVLASCSSKDIEFDLKSMGQMYTRENIAEHIDLYSNNERYFYLLGKGLPINFLHQAVVGPLLALVQSEIIYSIGHVQQQKKNELLEISEAMRQEISSKWLTRYQQLQWSS